MAWKKGPLPKESWGWGGVTIVGEDTGGGFYFADFQGDHVQLIPSNDLVMADKVALYDNSLELPPGKTCRAEG